jgi:hypothetical protein
LKLTVRCNQAAAVKLTGRVRVIATGHKTETFKTKVIKKSVTARHSRTLTVKLPRPALSALKAGAHESIVFNLTARNAGGTSRTKARIRHLTLA